MKFVLFAALVVVSSLASAREVYPYIRTISVQPDMFGGKLIVSATALDGGCKAREMKVDFTVVKKADLCEITPVFYTDEPSTDCRMMTSAKMENVDAAPQYYAAIKKAGCVPGEILMNLILPPLSLY